MQIFVIYLRMTITVDDSAVKRISNLKTEQSKSALFLRITVDGGGCSGFQYKMDLVEDMDDEDEVFGGCVVIDPISMPFLKDSLVSFADELIGSEFKITNPNAISGCGCGVSFAVKE